MRCIKVWNKFRKSVIKLNHDKLLYAKANSQIVGNKAKERNSKPVFQENKARQIFQKTNISYPLIRTCT